MASSSHGWLKSTSSVPPGLKGREAIASDCLNQSDLKQVYNVVFKARAKWRRIGLQLELTHGDLEAIDSHYRNPDDQLEQVLAKWLKGGEATWRQLMEALYSVPVGETALAKQIRMKHCQQDVPDLGVKRKHDDGRQQMERSISSMELEYALLSFDIRESLKRREIRPQKLSAFLLSFQSTRGALKLNGSLFINSYQQELNNASTIDAVFGIVSQFWSFLDYNLLENVVNAFGDDSDKQKFVDYTKALEEFLSDWKVVPHKIQRSEVPTTAVKLCFKLDSDSLPYRDIRASIARIFKVNVSNVLIQSIEKGSTKLVFLLPREAVVPYLTAELRKEIAEQIATFTPSVLHVLLLDGCEEHTLFETEKSLATSPVDPTHETTRQFKSDESERNVRIFGFDCEFLEPPPENLQTNCPVCLQIIREPHQVTCCGKKFCKSCIQHVQDNINNCPTCKAQVFRCFPDKGIKQSLYGLKVRCSHQKDGCEWTGELRQLDEHLNTDPQPEKQLDGCQFVEINCIYNCGDQLQRRYIQNHQIKDCPKRPFGCEHCRDYWFTYDDVTNNHWPVCGSFPVPCPNQCGSTIQRQNIDSHVADECPLTTINCDFHHVGCAVKLPRQDMPEHQREILLTHISLLATSHAKQQDEITQQREEITKQHFDIATQQIQITVLLAENDELNHKNTILHETIQSNTTRIAKLEPLQQALKTAPSNVSPRPLGQLGAPVLTMTHFEQYKKDNHTWCSPPVYTHPQGYKICLNVIANGTASGKGTHVSLGVQFMRGEFDDSLTWPFRGIISVRLLNQVSGYHETYSITYLENMDDFYCNRVTEGEKGGGWGPHKFISHSALEPKYLQSDTLLFQIYEVELLHQC